MTKGFQVIYEDNHIIAVNKDAGLLVQGDSTGDQPLVELVRDYIRKKYDKKGNVFCGLAHRIDRPVSGVVVLARTSKGLERMTKLFETREIQKTYWAVVTEKPEIEEGDLYHWIEKDRIKNVVKAHNSSKKTAQHAHLHYSLLGMIGRDYLLEIKPTTGRPHQIRVQLGKIGCPIKGDLKYGSTEKVGGMIFLHARKLTFEHPIKKIPIRLEAKLPEEIDNWRKFKHLG
ncbi:MAG: 23S rRNA pseudouridine1911/1915/1917 synthase [Arenicella sp.]|jgi:23S rRNA pseudouridine1911/1915/1917 synthase